MRKYRSNRGCTKGWRGCLVLLALSAASAASAEAPPLQGRGGRAAEPPPPAAQAPAAKAPRPSASAAARTSQSPAQATATAPPQAATPPATGAPPQAATPPATGAPPQNLPTTPATTAPAQAASTAQPVDDAAQLASFNDPPPGASLSPAEGTPTVLPAPPRLYGRRDPFMRLRVDGHVALTWNGGFGVGMRADFPLISGTFRYSNRDELAISAGGDVTFISFDGSHVVEVFPTATLQWSLSVNERAYFFPELGIVGHVDGGRWDGLHPNFGFGARYYLRRSFSLQGRLGWPVAFAGGVTF